ncbi:uncharacterized protein VP01_2886g4 [Puccinia sorghi]|uniref:Myb/SANT-like domain-containing protein n=1 Tax=Puccinia sorghi TaxID=27349 RepID=A0A0L6V1P3_9BASI|nr:uncharacterized protein VP01_2886g4 [Puccinia sorghi]
MGKDTKMALNQKHIALAPWHSRKNSRKWIWIKKTDFLCTQGFKKDYNNLSELKNSSFFGWNDETCEVTAPEQVWNKYLLIHIQRQGNLRANRSLTVSCC